MKTRPKGITILSFLMWVSVPWYLVLAALRLFNQPALNSILEGLSPGGAGPAETHAGMGALQTGLLHRHGRGVRGHRARALAPQELGALRLCSPSWSSAS
jgi:hypothetical protein